MALTAFDAVVSYESADGPGAVPISDFYLPVGDTPHRETALPPGALITHVTLPAAPVAARSRYRKVRERASYAFAIGSVAAALTVEDGRVREARLALGAVASAPGAPARPKPSSSAHRPTARPSPPPRTPSWPRPGRCPTTDTR